MLSQSSTIGPLTSGSNVTSNGSAMLKPRLRIMPTFSPSHSPLLHRFLQTHRNSPITGTNEKGDAPCTEPDAPPNIRSFKLRLRHSDTASHNAAHDEVTAGASR